MSKSSYFEDFVKRYTASRPSGADSFSTFKHKRGYTHDKDYARAVGGLYAGALKSSSAHESTYSKLADKGLQHSGYAAYINKRSNDGLSSSISTLSEKKNALERQASVGYLDYLEKYKSKQSAIRSDVMNHLIKGGVANLDAAISYGISAGLDKEEAIAVGNSAYAVTKQKLFNDIIKQSATLGLNGDGAKEIASNMGMSSEDAEEIRNMVNDMLEYYGSVSEAYLDFLEQQSSSSTKTFD